MMKDISPLFLLCIALCIARAEVVESRERFETPSESLIVQVGENRFKLPPHVELPDLDSDAASPAPTTIAPKEYGYLNDGQEWPLSPLWNRRPEPPVRVMPILDDEAFPSVAMAFEDDSYHILRVLLASRDEPSVTLYS